MTSWWVITVALGLYVVEFFADKIPLVDSAWDAVHTFIRIRAGAVLAAAAFGDFDKGVQLIAGWRRSGIRFPWCKSLGASRNQHQPGTRV